MERWFSEYQLANRNRVYILKTAYHKATKRAIVSFANPEEAQMAAWMRHKQQMGKATVYLRLLQ